MPKELLGYSAIEIEPIYVLQSHQHKKIGAAIITHCIRYARAHGYEALWLCVWEHNHSARAFYEKMGFEFFGSHIFRFGSEDQIDLLMKIDI